MSAEPGERFVYCSGGMHLLSGVISRVAGTSALELARRSLFGPLGISDVLWPSADRGVSHGWGDLHLHPRDLAKIGWMWLNRGMWQGKRVVSSDWVARSTRGWLPAGKDADYGYGWWVYRGERAGLQEALGRGGQRISLLPEKNVLVVFTGGGFEPAEIGEVLLAAIKSDGELEENAAALARLRSRIETARMPPAPRTPPPLPAMARAVSGRIFSLEPNELGLRTICLSFPSAAEARLRLTFADGRAEERPVGLDGVLRISPGRRGLPVGVRGGFEDDGVFAFEYDEIAGINCFRFRLIFGPDTLQARVRERTGELDVEIRGR